MAQNRSQWISRQVGFVCQQVRTSGSLPFQDVLSSEKLECVVAEMGIAYRECVFTPTVTLRTFLSQVLSADHSCHDAVMRLRGHRVSSGQSACSTDTSPYCKARKRLPENLPIKMARRVDHELHQVATRDKTFLEGRPLKMADGSALSMPDTPANQVAYPQPTAQKPGVGFPMAGLVVFICWHVGAVLDLAMGPYAGRETEETALLRKVFARLAVGNILVADTYFGNWWTIAMLRQCGVDIVCPVRQHRRYDFRRGRRLGFEDHVVTWPKPPRPEWMDVAMWESLPDELETRELRVRSKAPTTREDQLTIVTTLTQPEPYPKAQLSQAYHWRRGSELVV